MNSVKKSALLLGLALLLLPAASFPQAERENLRRWSFRCGLLMTGSSDSSEPAGYKVYSSITLEAGIGRRLNRSFSVELGLAPESHEVDRAAGGGQRANLGSIELLPLTLVLLCRPASGGSVHPYAGAGVNLTMCWEKSGELDSTDLTPSLGPAIAAGMDFGPASGVMFNLSLKWFAMTTDIKTGGARLARLKISPLSLSAGAKFGF